MGLSLPGLKENREAVETTGETRGLFFVQEQFPNEITMFEKVNHREDTVRREHDVLRFWAETQVFERLLKQNADGPIWSFLDGPITANNPMGVHHAWGRTYKDCLQRFHAMKGHKLRYQNGFDCQGLWVEVEVEKELGFRTKRDIERYGIERFVKKCKARALKYADIQTEQSRRLGYWMDWNNSYYTMDDTNNYMIWSFLGKCHERGLIYKGTDSMPWCPRCGTGISQHEMHEGYKDVTDTAVYLRLPLCGSDGEYLLVWTTTPWTLAANVACAVNPSLSYAKVRQDGATYYLAEHLADTVREKGGFEVAAVLPGADLVGWEYHGPYDELTAQETGVRRHEVVQWEGVSENEGTGVVHIAPGCGKEDFELARLYGLPVLAPVDENGVYYEDYGEFAGKNAADVADDVLRDLKQKGYFYEAEAYTHSYPHCWRCHTQLLFRHVHEWFIDMSWRGEIKANVRKCQWIPEWGEARELDWLDNMRDWMISKKRYWGLALPIFECECGWFDVVGSRDELKARAVEGWDSFEGHSPHRPWIDSVKIRCEKCGQAAERLTDVGNPWLDAGIVPYSTVAYDSDRDYWRQWVPADLVLECFPGQFRNWFYVLLAMSTMMEDIPPFKTLLGHASVFDENGEEMHKSKGNAIWFDDAVERMGADVMRWIYCRHDPTTNLSFGYGIGREVEKTVFNSWRNVYAFFCNYACLDEFNVSRDQVPVAERPDMDRWMLSNLNLFLDRANECLSAYDMASTVRAAEQLIDRLSNWYVRRNRKRFWRKKDQGDVDKLAAYQTLHEVLVKLCQALAPIVPFMTETMYRNLAHDQDPTLPDSVSLCRYPVPDKSLIDEKLNTDMDIAASLVSTVLSLRQQRNVRVRQPLSSVRALCREQRTADALTRFEAHILDETNVKQISTSVDPAQTPGGPGYSVAVHEGPEMIVMLDTALTEALVAEGLARDVVRRIQMLRKKADLEMDDRIELRFATESEAMRSAIESWSDFIKAETLTAVIHECTERMTGKPVKISGHEMQFEISKL